MATVGKLTVSKPIQPDPYERLLAAVLLAAWKDAHGRDQRERLIALRWLRSTGAANVCDWLGLPIDHLRARLALTGPGVYHESSHNDRRTGL